MSNKTTRTMALSALAAAIMAASASAAPVTNPTENHLIISEYVEGGAYNKAIELYNAGSAAVNLDDYKLVIIKDEVLSNTREIKLTANKVIAPGEVYVIANSLADTDSDKEHDLADLNPTDSNNTVSFNGKDPVRLESSNGTVLDYVDGPKDTTLSRKAGINTGSGNEFKVDQWNLPQKKDTVSGLGKAPETIVVAKWVCPADDVKTRIF